MDIFLMLVGIGILTFLVCLGLTIGYVGINYDDKIVEYLESQTRKNRE